MDRSKRGQETAAMRRRDGVGPTVGCLWPGLSANSCATVASGWSVQGSDGQMTLSDMQIRTLFMRNGQSEQQKK